MQLLLTALNTVQKIIDDFSGDFSIKNTDGKYVYVNEGWIRSAGVGKEEALGKKIEELFPDDIAEKVKNSDELAWNSEAPVIYENELIIHGARMHSVVIKWALRYKNGKPFFLCTFSDRPENSDQLMAFQKRIEKALEEVRNPA